jgi:hypothetical protein
VTADGDEQAHRVHEQVALAAVPFRPAAQRRAAQHHRQQRLQHRPLLIAQVSGIKRRALGAHALTRPARIRAASRTRFNVTDGFPVSQSLNNPADTGTRPHVTAPRRTSNRIKTVGVIGSEA